MRKRVKKEAKKYVTEKTFNKFEGRFDEGMRAIAQSFSRVDQSLEKINKTLTTHEQVMQLMLKEIKAIH